ncbi:MAG: NAD(P)/FAD-dependent oxidoreductase [Novosphingobium sp.]|nr:NAD(P)/FAD-dependent oxidoreductase [Novosphingobium sp.]
MTPESPGASSLAGSLSGIHEVIVIGAGFAGIYAVYRLRQAGLDVLCLEAAAEVGGVWYHNAYPGARCDLLSVDYSYSFSQDLQRTWRWTHRYADQPEILAYLKHVADRFDLRRHMRFNSRVSSMRRDDAAGLWHVETDTGTRLAARFVILATGPLTVPKSPDFPNYEDFQGEKYQTSRWPQHPVTFAGKRVGVIGTGSSGLQTIAAIAGKAAHLTVFQRTPAYTAPARNRPVSDEEHLRIIADYPAYRVRMKQTYAGAYMFSSGKTVAECSEAERREILERCYEEGGIGYVSAFTDVLFNEEANDVVASFLRKKMAERIRDPVLREKLIPRGFPVGARRPCIDTDYLEAYARDDVELVDLRETPIVGFTKAGLQTTGGHHRLDMVIVAIGFDAGTGAPLAIDPVNGSGKALSQAWAEGPQTYLGMTVAGFPNLFLMNSPGATSIFGNVPLVSEFEGDWIAEAITWLQAQGRTSIEASAQAQRAWTDELHAISRNTLLLKAPSWYSGGNIPGKKRGILAFLGGFDEYQAQGRKEAAAGYPGFVTR